MTRGLMDRLANGERTADLSASIVAHLRALLNTRRGESVTAPDFGVADMTDLVLSMPEGGRALERSLRDVIQGYEPRLTHVRVRQVPSPRPLQLRFQVSARLASDPRRAMSIETCLESGRFQVQQTGR